MSFLHPEFLWLAPLLAIPVLIHLLNRVRYRRVRWAAIDFLITSERRAVRRARLRQILLMALRTLLLAAALGVLLQPVLRGGIAELLGGSRQVAVLVDASASMSATDASGRAFDRARKIVGEALPSLAAGVKVTGGPFAAGWQSPFREPVQDRRAVASLIDSAELTGGAADVPRAIRSAAETLGRSGGGTLWLLTDLHASDWRADDAGAWESARRALEAAGRPRIVITDLAPKVESNFSISNLRTSPAFLLENDTPRLTATVELHGKSGGVTNVSLFFDGKLVDSRAVRFDAPGRSDVVFHLPRVSAGAHAGRLELSPDAVPADDRFYFVLHAGNRVPLLVVDGAPSSMPFAGAADFLALAAQPPAIDEGTRLPFSVKKITDRDLAGTDLGGFVAVILADVARLDDASRRSLRDYVSQGGLLILFPGPHTDVAAWSPDASGFPGFAFRNLVEAEEGKAIKVTWTLPTSPVTATLPAEGLDRVAIRKLFRLELNVAQPPVALVATSPPVARHVAPVPQVLATTDGGDPFLVSAAVGRGKVYAFAVSSQEDFSNLPFTPVLLLTIHRAALLHLVQVAEPPWLCAFAELRLKTDPGRCRVRTPDGKLLPLSSSSQTGGSPVLGTFGETGLAGIYRLVEGDVPPKEAESAPVVAAVNVPAEESILERIPESAVRALLPGLQVSFLRVDGGGESLATGSGNQTAATAFPLAAIAMMFLLGESLLAWSMSRPGKDKSETGNPKLETRLKPEKEKQTRKTEVPKPLRV
jgi:hypothetical protein